MTSLRAISLVALAVAVIACTNAGAGKLVVVNNTVLTRYEPGERKAAPAAEGVSLRPGPAIDRSLLAGKVALVHFWGSWCGPCRLEQPVFTALAKKYEGRVQFLGVDSRRDQRAAALAFWDEFKPDYPSIYDPPSRIAYAWRVPNMPATYILDRSGGIAAVFVGAADDEKALETIFAEELAR